MVTNIFKKYTAGVYCIQSENHDLRHGDNVTITTKYGKEVDCVIWKKLFTKGEYTYYSYVREDGFCSKERLLKKAENRKEWAGNALNKSHEYYEKSNKDRDFLVLGEPIKVGHHSERRHRKAIDDAWNNMGKCVEFNEKAAEHER